MHVNLLLENKKCLIVGGGKIALHKLQLLLKSKAQVHVISPEIQDEIIELQNQNKITYDKKYFEESDIADYFLVYASTNSRSINKNILHACQKKNILCCCVDGNWSEGDFITPATTQHNQLTLSISSGGISCRQSKLVKNTLAKQMPFFDTAHLVIIGTDHHCLSVEEREGFHLFKEKYEKLGFLLVQLLGIHEFMILNTCNRIEIIAVTSLETIQNEVIEEIVGFTKLSSKEFYIKKNQQAFEHLCLVTSGMLSQTPGENYITAQVKESLEMAKAKGWADNMLQEWISSALFVSKEIKNEVIVNMKTEDIESVVMQFLKSKNIQSNDLMIIGTGFLGKKMLEEAVKNFTNITWCYHENKPDLPSIDNATIDLVGLESMKKYLHRTICIINTSAADRYLISPNDGLLFDSDRNTYIVDLSVPRAISPLLEKTSKNITLINLDDLKNWNKPGLCHVYDFLSASRTIIKNNMSLYEKITYNFQGRN